MGPSISRLNDLVNISTAGVLYSQVLVSVSRSPLLNSSLLVLQSCLSQIVLHIFPVPVTRDIFLCQTYEQEEPMHLKVELDHGNQCDSPVVTPPWFSVFQMLQ